MKKHKYIHNILNKPHVISQRLWMDEVQSTGVLYIVDEKGQPIFGSMCIERGDRNNQHGVSNIPAGTYPLRYTYSPKFKRNMWLVDEVPGRTGIRIHPANYWNQLQGCIAPGIDLKDLNHDGYYDVTRSRDTTARFEKVLQNETETTIIILNP